MDGRAADKIALRQLSQAVTLLAVTMVSGTIEYQSFPPDMPAFELGPPHAGSHTLDYQATLQLSDGADDDHHRPAQRPARVDLLSEADELDFQPVELIQHFEEVFHRPGYAVASPYQDEVELTAAGIAHHSFEPGSPSLRATDHVGVLFDDPIAALFSHLTEVIELGFRMLIEGGDSHI